MISVHERLVHWRDMMVSIKAKQVDSRQVISGIQATLGACVLDPGIFRVRAQDLPVTSAVLLLLGPGPTLRNRHDICLILNKRSRRVRQPGDLCCPGGSISLPIDFRLSRLLGMPLLPLARWPNWRSWRRERPVEARWLALYLATGLREAFEEMRLNPFRIRFLGPLEAQRLILFRRRVYPLVAWVPHQKLFRLNWEVERIVRIPLASLLDRDNYVRYRLTMTPPGPGRAEQVREHPAFRFKASGMIELLWGVTYRIVMSFLACCFGFAPPPLENLPLVEGRLSGDYLTGERDGVVQHRRR